MLNYKTKQNDDGSELRQDLLTGEWVIVATSRGKRPDEFILPRDGDQGDSNEDPFADPESSGQEHDVLIYRDDSGEWTTRVFPNKYPALMPFGDLRARDDGPYTSFSGVGAHEIVVTRDSKKHIGLMDVPAVAEVIDAYQDRYIAHMSSRAVRYVSIFHNHGPRAGASVAHPHSQVLALPVVPIVVQAEIDAVERFHRKNCVSPFRVTLDHELTTRDRIVVENDDFVVFCPFASRVDFNMCIMPKDPQPYFERITDSKKVSLAEVFSAAVGALDGGFNSPDYNFFIHTSPCDGWDYEHYTWYIDIMPRFNKIAGFELATSMEIITISPEDAASFLRQCM